MKHFEHQQIVALTPAELALRRFVGIFSGVAYNDMLGVAQEPGKKTVRVMLRRMQDPTTVSNFLDKPDPRTK